jgi:hypothetical protein
MKEGQASMWSTATRNNGKEIGEINTMKDTARNVKYIHMQISTPKTGNKTRASKVKEALMIIFATSKYIKLHPKEAGGGEIITNIDDLVTTEEFTDQYFFDKKIGGKKYIRGEGSVEFYVTKVRLETDIGLNKMKWHTSTKFLEALKAQNIFLREYQDGTVLRTGNVGWLAGLNPANTSINKTTEDLNSVIKGMDATAILDVHTVSIRFPLTKKAFVTRAYKVMSNIEKIEEVKKAIKSALQESKMGVGWDTVELVTFNMDKNATAMMIEKHNRLLHNTAVVSIRNIWSITEKGDSLNNDEHTQLGLNITEDKVSTIEEIWWSLSNKYNQDIRGMVARRGTLEILTTRANLNDTVRFARQLVSNTIEVLGDKRFAKLTANHSPDNRQPTIQEAPTILSGRGKVKLDTTYFTEDEFKDFANKHGILLGNNDTDQQEITADLTRPPKAFYHKAGREPVEHDPRKLREGAKKVWEKFAATTKTNTNQNKEREDQAEGTKTTNEVATTERIQKKPTSEEIKQKGKMIRMENAINKMKESQVAMEKNTNNCQDKITLMKKNTEESINKMSDMIAKMGESITVQNQQLEAQALAQVRQAEDIQKIMIAIQAISSAVNVTPTTQEDTHMQIDVAESNINKRKQASFGLTTFITEERESIATHSTKAGSQQKEVRDAGRQ